MVIDLTGSSSQQALAARDKVSTQKSSGEAAPVVTNAPAKQAPKDTVELSKEAKAIASAKSSIADSPDVDSDKVSRLKAAIESGSYQVDSQKVAQKMFNLESMLG